VASPTIPNYSLYLPSSIPAYSNITEKGKEVFLLTSLNKEPIKSEMNTKRTIKG